MVLYMTVCDIGFLMLSSPLPAKHLLRKTVRQPPNENVRKHLKKKKKKHNSSHTDVPKILLPKRRSRAVHHILNVKLFN